MKSHILNVIVGSLNHASCLVGGSSVVWCGVVWCGGVVCALLFVISILLA